MSGWLDDMLVGIALCLGFGYATYSLGPKSWRARWFGGTAAVLRRLPGAALRRAAEHVAARAGTTGGACGGCADCGSTSPRTERSGTSEVRIPLAKIGKRR
jgi:hypothetical protein